MKHLFSNLTMVAILVTTVIFTSCQKEEVTNPSETGKLSFGFNLKTQVLYKGMEGPELKTTSNINPVAVIANLVDENGRVVFKNKRITLHKKDGVYATQPQELERGNYTLTDYCLVDADSVIVGAAYKKNEASSSELITTLPFKVTVSKGEIATLSPEVMSTKVEGTSKGRLKSSEGYSMITFDFVYPNSNSLVMDFKKDGGKVYIFWGDGSSPVEATGSNVPNTTVAGKYSVMLFGDVASITRFQALGFNITNINISSAYNIEYLTLWNASLGISEIDISSLTALKSINLIGNHLSSIDISNNLNLEGLSAWSNQITAIKSSYNPKFKELILWGNELVSFDASNFPELTLLNCSHNKLANLDLSYCPKLEFLYSASNELNNLDVTTNLELTILDVADNLNVTSIDISKNAKLDSLNISHTGITNIDITNNKKLNNIKWVSNVLQPEDVNNLYTQFFIHASVNNITDGKLTTSKAEPTSPLAIQLKKSLVDTYNWTINE